MWAKITITVLAILIVSALAALQQETVDNVCLAVGALSGCSGCEHGTNGMCRFIRFKVSTGIFSHSCVPSERADYWIHGRGALLSGKRYSSGAFLCPSVLAEPTVKYDFIPDPDVDADKKRSISDIAVAAKKASTAYSTTVKSDKTSFNNGKSAIDRTAAVQVLGSMRNSKTGGRKRFIEQTGPRFAELTCETFNSAQLKTEVELYDGCNVGAGSYGPSQRVCKGLVHAVWTKFLCPEWGVATSGYCEKLTDSVTATCVDAGCDTLWPWAVFQPSFNIIRSDLSKFCISNVTGVEMSGTYEAAAGFHHSAATLNPLNAFVGTFSMTPSTAVSTINGAREVLGDTFQQVGSSTRLYEVVYFRGTGLLTKRGVGPFFGGRWITLDNGTVYQQFLDPYHTPWAEEVSLLDGTVVYQLNGLVNFPSAGSYELHIEADDTMQLRINGTRLGAPDEGFPVKRFTYDFANVEFEAGWVPFELTGFFSSPNMASITFEIDGLKVGEPGGPAVRTFSLETPVPALLDRQWYCDGCEPPPIEGKDRK